MHSGGTKRQNTHTKKGLTSRHNEGNNIMQINFCHE